MASEEPRRKTIKLVFCSQDIAQGYRDYTAAHELSDTPSVLKTVATPSLRNGGMTLLFRGRKLTSDEENMTFESLMEKFHVSLDEEVLLFHCIVALPTSSSTGSRQSDVPRRERHPQVIPIHSSTEPLRTPTIPTPVQSANDAPALQIPQDSPAGPAVGTSSAQLPSLPSSSYPHVSRGTQQQQRAIHQTTAQSSSTSQVRPNVQVVPIQYQALLIDGLPFLWQLARTPIRLTSDMAIPVTTHEGQQALIVTPAGVASLAQQGFRIEIRLFQQSSPTGAQHPPAEPQIPPPPERRFGLTDLVSLFRRRLGQQLWLMCKLAFMVGIFSSNNASWRRIIGLCIAAAAIFFWQTGELERWVRRFRRPPVAGHVPPAPPAPPQQPLPDRQQQEGPMAAMAAGLRLAEQILFVFVASLWPNALDGGEVPAMIREGGQPARNQNGDDGGEEDEF